MVPVLLSLESIDSVDVEVVASIQFSLMPAEPARSIVKRFGLST